MSANERERLSVLMDRSRMQQNDMRWEEVARRGNISLATLRRIRLKPESVLTERSKVCIENGLDWQFGDVDVVLGGGMYSYRRPLLDPRTANADDILQFLEAMQAERREEFRAAIHKIDARWKI